MIESEIHFLLVPDANARRLVLAKLVEHRSSIGVIVGIWPELVSQVINDYCLVIEQDAWHEELNGAMASMPDAFWAASYQVDPDVSYRILEATLTNLITSVPVDSSISTIDLDGIKSIRSKNFLADFITLLAKVNRLPNDLSVMQQICVMRMPVLNSWQITRRYSKTVMARLPVACRRRSSTYSKTCLARRTKHRSMKPRNG